MPFTTLARDAHDSLLRRAAALKSSAPEEVHTVRFRTSELILGQEPQAVDRLLRDWEKRSTRWIYVFDTAASQSERKALAASFAQAKKGKAAKFRYARLNDPEGAMEALYVGSSESLRSRIRNHLGYLVGPSSLNMAHWPGMPDIEVRLRAARYPNALPKEALLDLEDRLAVTLAPIFGKRGSA